ncbi:PREDICTED: uncharacterized protein LOC101313498 [Fragaria vesca subsp. vesca]
MLTNKEKKKKKKESTTPSTLSPRPRLRPCPILLGGAPPSGHSKPSRRFHSAAGTSLVLPGLVAGLISPAAAHGGTVKAVGFVSRNFLLRPLIQGREETPREEGSDRRQA